MVYLRAKHWDVFKIETEMPEVSMKNKTVKHNVLESVKEPHICFFKKLYL